MIQGSIRFRLVAGFAAIVLALVAITIYFGSFVESQRQGLELLRNEHDGFFVLDRVSTSFTAYQVVSLVPDATDASMQPPWDAFQSRLAAYRQVSPHLADQVSALADDYVLRAADVRAASRGHEAAAIKDATQRMRQTVIRMGDVLRSGFDELDQRYKQRLAAELDSQETWQEGFRLAIGAGMLGVLAYAAFLFATIVLPLGATVAGIRALRRGAEPPALPRKGEFGQISTVLEELRDATQRVRDLAFFDSLTGLSSRARFEQALGEALAKSKRNPGALTVVLIELHRLREIASAYGPAVVERCLRAAGERALFAVPAAHTPSRYGESRLAYLVAGGEPEGVTTEARGILEALRAPLAIDGLMLQLEAHAGVARHPQDGADVPALLAAAETALVSARGRRPGEVAAFDPAISETFRRDFALLQDLERGLGHGEIVPYFHPIIDCGRGEACAAEALARWQHPTRGLLAPASFLPLAERTGQIVVIDGHVLERAIEQQVQWRAAGLRVRIAVNLSPRYLAAAMVTRVEHALRRHHAHAADLVTELTETAVIAHGDDTDHVIRGLHALGATICLDDFGTGYSSLSYVRRLPIGQIKIDRSFVAEIGRSPAAERIIEATLTLARSIDIEVIAEGVETREQMLWLMRRGCMLQQGYLFARPQPAAEFATWLEGSSVELLALLGMGRALQA